MSEKSADVLLLGKNLYNNNQDYEQLEKQRETLAATIIHDLKNPLQAQISGLELLCKGTFGILNHSQQEILNLTLDSAKYMLSMISDILLAFKSENGGLAISLVRFNVENFVNEIVKENISSAREKSLVINVVSKLTPKHKEILADKRIFRRIVENLLSNAIIYSNKNTEIKIELNQKTSMFEFNIGTVSPEIPKHIADKIFDKYVTVGCEKIGIGLGLYFCKLAIEAHKGSIELITGKNYNVFTFKIPMLT